MLETPQPDLSEVLAGLAADAVEITRLVEVWNRRAAEVAAMVWDARLVNPPAGSPVRPKLYTYALGAARRLTKRGGRVTQSRLLTEIRDFDCATVKEHEREPLWRYVCELLELPDPTENGAPAGGAGE